MGSQWKLRSYLTVLCSVFLLFLLFPAHFFVYPAHGPLASGDLALHLATRAGLVFGRDIVLPYGPLGILHSRLPIAVSAPAYLVFDIYFLLSLALIIRKILREHFHYGVIAYLIVAFALNSHRGLEDWFFFFLLFHLFAYLQTPTRHLYLLQAAIAAALGFFCRADIGMLGVCIYLAALCYASIARVVSWRVFLFSYPDCYWRSASLLP